MYKSVFKPAFDLLLSLTALVVLSPIIMIIGLSLYFTQGYPVFFCQDRPGKDGRIFKLYKFRTMTTEVSGSGVFLSDDVRITGFGRFLRRFSLDELPQLLNVLKGELSIVGPRPLLVEYLQFYTEEQKRRHSVKPGITGWAQVNGRNSISWEEKFALDVYYVDNISFRLDMKIILKTVTGVFTSADIYNDKGSTMEKFTGNRL